ncbi:uncharacterized protein LOC109861137 [Pseudomyrmex gracilis]|uniref:uncharacterized protein LOC109861137 n=1 Tax=Pseudomyrmex gracilis TaxID=219809 RepID=UPI000994CF46|nr:uncharacterized protein LOC109861137 [Pseudomyrmex gracilis]
MLSVDSIYNFLKVMRCPALENLSNTGTITRHRVEIRLHAVNEQWEEFYANHKAITLALSMLKYNDFDQVRQHPYLSQNIYSSTRECYLETAAKMTSLLEDFSNVLNRPSPQPSESQPPTFTALRHGPRLPRIDLPKFNGSLSDWLPFRDLFSSIVLSNATNSPVEKLQYLKTSLIGSSSHLLKNTALTADNFQKAWDSLTAFYENDRLLVHSALQSLFSMKRMTKESVAEIEQLYTSIMQIYRTFETLQRPIDTWDDILVFMMVQRLDTESVKAWEHHLGSSKKLPTWDQFREFLMTRMLTLQAFEKSQIKPSSQLRNQSARSHSVSSKSTGEKPDKTCLLCEEEHYIAYCPKYQQKTIKQRLDLVSAKGLCFNCLGHHRATNCQSTRRCIKCGKRHHTTLHKTSTQEKTKTTSDVRPQTSSSIELAANTPPTAKESTKVVHHIQPESFESNPSVLLATAKVKVVNHHGEIISARVLLDQGSEVSLVTEKLVQQLHLCRKASHLCLIGVGRQSSGKTKGIVTLSLRPHFDTNTEVFITAYIFPKLTSALPAASLASSTWPHLRNLPLADPEFMKPGNIDIIIGAEMYGQLLEGSIRKGPSDAPIAQLTKFGWIISGPTNAISANRKSQNYHCTIDYDLYELIKRFWHQEEICPAQITKLSSAEQNCEKHFALSHSRDSTGRYIVRIPFKLPPEQLGDSKPSALKMLNHLQRKFQKDPMYYKAYSSFLSEYENLQHMSKVPVDESKPEQIFYLPHHGVIRESSTTTKLRVVFNGSCSVINGLTLNEVLHTGPKLQTDIFDVLIRFRQFQYAYSCDVEKMYRQIQVHPDDQKFQRILWKENQKLISFQQLIKT